MKKAEREPRPACVGLTLLFLYEVFQRLRCLSAGGLPVESKLYVTATTYDAIGRNLGHALGVHRRSANRLTAQERKNGYLRCSSLLGHFIYGSS